MYKMFIDWHLVLRNSELKCSPLVVSIVNYAYLNYIAWKKNSNGSGVIKNECPTHASIKFFPSPNCSRLADNKVLDCHNIFNK